MFLTQFPYWVAGFACGILLFLIAFFIENDYSFYTKRTTTYNVDTKSNLHYLYLACKAYWADTNPTNACNTTIASLTTYGYIQSRDVIIWGDSGNATNFSAKGKHPMSEKVFKLEHKGSIRALKENELESALNELTNLKR